MTQHIEPHYTVEIPVIAPFPWHCMLDYLDDRLIAEKESIKGAYYLRDHKGYLIAVGYKNHPDRLMIQICKRAQVSEKPINNPLVQEIKQRVEQLFQPQLSTLNIYNQLKMHFPIKDSYLGFRPLGAWDKFELCLRTIIGQQVSVKAAQTLMQRLLKRCPQLSPLQVAETDLSSIGMPGKRVATLQNFAFQIMQKKIILNTPWPSLRTQLLQLKGIGPWTCDYLGIRLGRDEDAFPVSDLGLIRAVKVDSARELSQMAENWKPYRAYAATYLWNHGPI